MSTLLHAPPPVHSNPPPAEISPGPCLRAFGQDLHYPACNLIEAGRHYEAHGTVGGCPVVEPEDVELLDTACEHDCPAEPRLPLADWIACQASYFRSLESDPAAWLAAEIQELADLAQSLHAATPDQFDGRRAALDGSAERRLAELRRGEF
jgi:hypothetical protein